MGYPRSVTGVFNESDTAYLEHLFFSKLVKYSGVYYKLWRHLNETRDPTTTHLMAKWDRFIEHTFGPGYVVVNDFHSYRDHKFKQFPDARIRIRYSGWSTRMIVLVSTSGCCSITASTSPPLRFST